MGKKITHKEGRNIDHILATGKRDNEDEMGMGKVIKNRFSDHGVVIC